MSVSVILFVFSLMVLVLLFFCVLEARRPPSPLLKKLTAAGVKLGGVEHLMARGEFWVRQEQLMTDREVHFVQGLFRRAGIPLLRSRDSHALQRMIRAFLSALHKEHNPAHSTIRGEV